MAEDEARTYHPRPLLEALESTGVRYVVIGGTAAVIRGATHLTLRALGARPYGMPDEALESFRLDGATLHGGSSWKFLTEHGELDVVLDPDGTRGYADLRRGASHTEVFGLRVLVASLEDVIRSKEASNRDRDRAVLPDLRRTLERKRKRREE